jgi:cytoskeletal protein CcmA (bactofilin family)
MQSKLKPTAATSLVAQGTSLSGDLEFNKELVIAGSVNGSINCNGDDNSVVKILEGGQLVGEINAPIVEIMGQVEATITGTVSVSVGATAKVTGVLRFNQLQVSPGALITGELVPIGDAKKDRVHELKPLQKRG